MIPFRFVLSMLLIMFGSLRAQVRRLPPSGKAMLGSAAQGPVVGGKLNLERTGTNRPHVAKPGLRIRVYDYADTHPVLLNRARQQASEILERAGVHPRWEHCRTSDAEPIRDLSCAQPTGPHLIRLRIHPRQMANKLTKSYSEFGYAIPLTTGLGVVAGVYLERTKEMAGSLGIDAYVVLGHTMAHEIGHLLLGSTSHARAGIMKPTWGGVDVRLAKQQAFGFTESQAKQMQARVAVRLGRIP